VLRGAVQPAATGPAPSRRASRVPSLARDPARGPAVENPAWRTELRLESSGSTHGKIARLDCQAGSPLPERQACGFLRAASSRRCPRSGILRVMPCPVRFPSTRALFRFAESARTPRARCARHG
jgi:hypothetical protein